MGRSSVGPLASSPCSDELRTLEVNTGHEVPSSRASLQCPRRDPSGTRTREVRKMWLREPEGPSPRGQHCLPSSRAALSPAHGHLQGLPLQGRRALEGTGSSSRRSVRTALPPPALDDGAHRAGPRLAPSSAQIAAPAPPPAKASAHHGDDKQWDKRGSTAPAGNYPRMPAGQRAQEG